MYQECAGNIGERRVDSSFPPTPALDRVLKAGRELSGPSLGNVCIGGNVTLGPSWPGRGVKATPLEIAVRNTNGSEPLAGNFQ